MVTALLLMAGTGRRFGSPLPKQFHRLSGKKIYQHTLQRFIDSGLFDEILLVVHPECVNEVAEEVKGRARVIAGGSTRQESSYFGLLASTSSIVCIHDAVRPFVTLEILKENIALAKEYGAANTCIPSTDTLAFAPHNHDVIENIPIRSDYLRGQTPQTFQRDLILRAHNQALLNGITNASDDCLLILNLNHPVRVAKGSESNIKITTELDLCLADQILRLSKICPQEVGATLKGKRYIVTGATGGIGRALREALESEEAECISLSRSSLPFQADLTSSAAAQRAFQAIFETYGPIDGLINSIGYLKCSPLSTLCDEEIETQLSTNLKALIFCCKYAKLKEAAHIINIASSSYARGRRDFTVYASTKAAVVNFTQGLAEERPTLCINALVPARANTAMRLANFPQDERETLLEPQQIAREIITLLKQNSITGSVIEVRATEYRV
jgi:ribitol-5-phosphate 2-dehydrogenase (NADP+) / D-ribitol-5-phosphate cytidylyltransferase